MPKRPATSQWDVEPATQPWFDDFAEVEEETEQIQRKTTPETKPPIKKKARLTLEKINPYPDDANHPKNVANMYGIFVAIFRTVNFLHSENRGEGWYFNPKIHTKPVRVKNVLSNKQTDLALRQRKGDAEVKVCVVIKQHTSYVTIPKSQRHLFCADGGARMFFDEEDDEQTILKEYEEGKEEPSIVDFDDLLKQFQF